MSDRRHVPAVGAPRKVRLVLAWCAGLAFAIGQAAAAAPEPDQTSAPDTFKLYLWEPGVYSVSYEKLAAAGFRGRPDSAGLALDNAGRAVPIWVVDGGDGTFGPGDRIEFVGDRLPGEAAWYNEFATLNVYNLSWSSAPGLRMQASIAPAEETLPAEPLRAGVRQHLERDLILLRFRAQGEAQEPWYWAKLTQIDPQSLRVPLDLPGLDAASVQPVRVTVHLRGWSRPGYKPPGTTDHRTTVEIAGREATADWDNKPEGHRIELELPAAALATGKHGVSLRVPPRLLPDSRDSMVDVAVLNWIEVAYPRTDKIADQQVLLEVAGRSGAVTLTAKAAGSLVGYGAAGTRVAFEPAGSKTGLWSAPSLGGERRLWVVPTGAYRSPSAIELDRPSNLASAHQQADYIVITHPRLRTAIQPLVDFHRQRGLKVAVVEVQDIYDEFNHGILHPRAIRSFLRRAYETWQRPAPRFVLLVGDASWDARNAPTDAVDYPDAVFGYGHGTNFAYIGSTPYSEIDTLDHRNLVPAWSYNTADGHAAGDNWFVDVEGDDLKPEMAVGRFPVTEPSEVEAIVAKTIRYASAPAPGSWRNEVVWVTNEDSFMQTWADEMAADLSLRGFTARKVYPTPLNGTETERSRDQDALLRALTGGELLVHFMGHGGRFIWRTGPPDWTKHRDLFNLDDIDRLPPSERLPVVLSMTCYSAPFDHPTADSIGEKFLRVKDKGAVAVVAASWRNAPYKEMSQSLINEMLATDSTLGEAMLRVKRKSNDREFIKQYNLLGDPALRLARSDTTAAATSAGTGEAKP